MTKGGGQTIVVAGGGGTGTGAGRGGGNGGSSGGGGGKDKGPLSGGKLKMNDQMFWGAMTVLALAGGAAYVYTTRPDLVNEFVGNLTKFGQPATPAVPLQQPGQITNDVIPQQQAPAPSTNLPYQQTGALPNYSQQPMNYPYPQQATGMNQFQFPQQQSPNLAQYQPYQPTNYGGGGDFSTSFNPAFGQNSNQPTYSFAARRLSQLEFDSSDGLLTRA